MKELRGRTSSALLRIAFAFDKARVAQILCGGDKKGLNEQRFYKQLIGRADTLFDRHLAKMASMDKSARHKPKRKE